MNGQQLAAEAGVTYRQIDYWTRLGYLRPLDATPGQGHQRDYSWSEVRVAARMARLVKAGLTPAAAAKVARGDAASVEQLRQALEAS